MLILGLAVFGALLLIARLSRNDGIILSAVTLTCVWLAWSGFILATEIYEPWWFGIAIDAIAAFALTVPGASRGRIALASLYWVQIAVHTSYGWSLTTQGKEPYELYTNVIDALAGLQILFVGGWGIVDILRGRGVHPMERGEPDYLGMAKRGSEK